MQLSKEMYVELKVCCQFNCCETVGLISSVAGIRECECVAHRIRVAETISVSMSFLVILVVKEHACETCKLDNSAY